MQDTHFSMTEERGSKLGDVINEWSLSYTLLRLVTATISPKKRQVKNYDFLLLDSKNTININFANILVGLYSEAWIWFFWEGNLFKLGLTGFKTSSTFPHKETIKNSLKWLPMLWMRGCCCFTWSEVRQWSCRSRPRWCSASRFRHSSTRGSVTLRSEAQKKIKITNQI